MGINLEDVDKKFVVESTFAPNTEYLQETHEKGYKIVREKNPDLLIIFITQPYFNNNESTYEKQHNGRVYRRNYNYGNIYRRCYC